MNEEWMKTWEVARYAAVVALFAACTGCSTSLTLTTTPVDTYNSEIKYTQKCGGLKAWFNGCPQQPTQIEGS